MHDKKWPAITCGGQYYWMRINWPFGSSPDTTLIAVIRHMPITRNGAGQMLCCFRIAKSGLGN